MILVENYRLNRKSQIVSKYKK